MNLILLGAPGAGKGTQAEVISKKYHLFHVSTGNLFRKALSDGKELGQMAKSYMERGELVPDDVVMRIVVENLPKDSGYLFDGFPRNLNQAESLDKMLALDGKTIDLVINIDVSWEHLLARTSARGREDDNLETIKNRFRIYEKETAPLKVYYFEQRKLKKIDGNANVTDVSHTIEEVLETYCD